MTTAHTIKPCRLHIKRHFLTALKRLTACRFISNIYKNTHMNEYTEQANTWLQATNSTIEIKRVPDFMQKPPLWDGPHGHQYVIKLKRDGKEYRFDFWDSYANMQKERNGSIYMRIHPTAYDVLACLDTYTDESVSLGDFMADFGYEVKDVDKAQKTLQALQEQSRALRGMYSETELQALGEIA